MASEHVLEFDEFLQPISADEPAGGAVPFTTRQEMEDARKEDNPEDYDENDPRRPQEAKKADWPMIVRLAKEVLTNSSKDLMTAARLTEALLKLHRFAGLRDGLMLLSKMVDGCWDFLYPPLQEPDDMEIRAAAFNWLDDPDRGARFPSTVQATPMIFGEKAYGWLDWRLASEKKPDAPTPEEIEKAIQNTSAEQCRDTFEDIKACRDLVAQLSTTLNERMGQVAPSFTFLRPAIENSFTFMQQIVKRKGPAPEEESEAPAEGEEGAVATDGAGGTTAARPRKTTREDLYRMLNDVAAQLQAIEPHSPIPYLIQRAVALGAMPFPDLMRALIRDENVLTEMNRELGIQAEVPAE